MHRLVAESGILPDGALQCVVGPTGDLFDHLTGQDVVSFTTTGTPARIAGASFSSRPQHGKLKALMWTAQPWRCPTARCNAWSARPATCSIT
jgi:hypothetical protein